MQEILHDASRIKRFNTFKIKPNCLVFLTTIFRGSFIGNKCIKVLSFPDTCGIVHEARKIKCY